MASVAATRRPSRVRGLRAFACVLIGLGARALHNIPSLIIASNVASVMADADASSYGGRLIGLRARGFHRADTITLLA
jgi:hypothetical protein